MTKMARDTFERLWRTGPQYGITEIMRAIVAETGLTVQQARDATLGESADEWRRAFAAQLKEELNADA